MRLLVWELRSVVIGRGTFAIGFLVDFFEVRGAAVRIVPVGWTLIGVVVFGPADHTKIVLTTTFLLSWEELAVGTEDFREIGFFGLRGRSG